jgi:hypothetical protein
MTSESDLRPGIGLFRLSLIAIFVGILTEFGAIGFRGLIGFIHNLLLTGLAATAFIKGLHRVEWLFNHIRNPYFRHAAGVLLVGLIIYALLRAFGHYYVEGVGYATVQDVLLGGLRTIRLAM